MEEQRTKDSGNKTRSTQQISVPFLWEEKPGMAKKVWNPRPPGPLPSRPPPPPPPTFTVSVPFKWEEKPGTPLRTFAPEPAKNTSLPLPPSYYQFFECFESEEESSFDDDEEEPEWLTELEQDAYSCHVPASTSSSTTSSRHATGNTSPVGNSFLEQLFPLYAPKANAPQPHSLKGERSTTVIRRPHTLGELIMLSRRRTYLHKSLYNRNNSISKELKEPNDLGCCVFGGGIGQVFRGNRLFSLKFA